MAESETPRTDAASYDTGLRLDHSFELEEPDMVVSAHFCRLLERELLLKDQKIAELEQNAVTALHLLVDMTLQCGYAIARAESLQSQLEAFRDTVLHQRGSLAENGMTNDQVNDVLSEFDTAIAAAQSGEAG